MILKITQVPTKSKANVFKYAGRYTTAEAIKVRATGIWVMTVRSICIADIKKLMINPIRFAIDSKKLNMGSPPEPMITNKHQHENKGK